MTYEYLYQSMDCLESLTSLRSLWLGMSVHLYVLAVEVIILLLLFVLLLYSTNYDPSNVL